MYVAKLARTTMSLVQPAVTSLSARLFVLSAYRAGSALYRPSIASFYETGLVTSLYEHLLMSPVLAHLEIRHEMPYASPGAGAPERVDIWIRPPTGGYPHLIEAGDFGVGKVHRDLAKAARLNPRGSNWFLAFFRGDTNAARDPVGKLEASFSRTNGLDANRVAFDERLAVSFEVYSPDGAHLPFGAAMLRAR